MKKSIILSLLMLVFIIACEEKEPQIEILKDYDKEYLTDKNVDSPARIKGGVSNTKLFDDVKSFINKVDDKNSKVNRQYIIYYRLYINTEGKVEKIRPFQSPEKEILQDIKEDQLFQSMDLLNKGIVDVFRNLEYEAAQKDGKSVNYRKDIFMNIVINPDGEIITDIPEIEEIYPIDESIYFVAVEEMPKPIGGITAIQKQIVYPEIAKRAGIQGKVYVKTFIDENGGVIKTEIVKGIGSGCDEAAMDAIKKTKFTPGKQRGKTVKVQVMIPIMFKLQ